MVTVDLFNVNLYDAGPYKRDGGYGLFPTMGCFSLAFRSSFFFPYPHKTPTFIFTSIEKNPLCVGITVVWIESELSVSPVVCALDLLHVRYNWYCLSALRSKSCSGKITAVVGTYLGVQSVHFFPYSVKKESPETRTWTWMLKKKYICAWKIGKSTLEFLWDKCPLLYRQLVVQYVLSVGWAVNLPSPDDKLNKTIKFESNIGWME